MRLKNLLALVALSTIALSSTATIAIAGDEGCIDSSNCIPSYSNHSNDTGQVDRDCGIGFFHVQIVGGVKVCTPASQVSSEQSYS